MEIINNKKIKKSLNNKYWMISNIKRKAVRVYNTSIIFQKNYRVIQGGWYYTGLRKTERKIVMKILLLIKAPILYLTEIFQDFQSGSFFEKVVLTLILWMEYPVYCHIFRFIVALWIFPPWKFSYSSLVAREKREQYFH